MAIALLALLVALYLLLAVGVGQYRPRTRWLLVGASVALPGTAYFFL